MVIIKYYVVRVRLPPKNARAAAAKREKDSHPVTTTTMRRRGCRGRPRAEQRATRQRERRRRSSAADRKKKKKNMEKKAGVWPVKHWPMNTNKWERWEGIHTHVFWPSPPLGTGGAGNATAGAAKRTHTGAVVVVQYLYRIQGDTFYRSTLCVHNISYRLLIFYILSRFVNNNRYSQNPNTRVYSKFKKFFITTRNY